MAVVKADGYGHGMRARAPGPPCRRRHLARRGPLEEALALRAAGVDGRRSCPGCTARATPCRSAVRRRHRPVRSRPWALDEVARPRPRTSAGRHGCTSRSTPGWAATARQPADWPDLVDAAAKAAGRRRGRGRRGLVALRLRRRARTTRPSPPAARSSTTRWRAAERAGPAPAGAAPGQLGGHADRPGRPLRPGPARASRSTGSRRCPTSARPATRAAPGDDAARPAGAGQAGPGRAGRRYGHDVPHRARDHARPGPARLRRRRARAAPATSARCCRPGGAATDRRPGLHGPVRRRPRRRPASREPATRSCCSAPATHGEPTRAGLGRRHRHDHLRDRHPDRAAGPARATSAAATHERDPHAGPGRGRPRRRRASARRSAWRRNGVAASRTLADEDAAVAGLTPYGSLRGRPRSVVTADGDRAARRGRRSARQADRGR